MSALDKFSYQGKRVIVTGAASGIGKATAEVLESLGAEVYSLDIRETEVGTYVPLDLADRESIERAAEAVGGPVHGLFNIGGLGSSSPPDRVILVDFVGTRHLIDTVVPLMPPGSAIANVASWGNNNWRGNLDEVRPLLETDGFEAGRAWIAGNVERFEGGAFGWQGGNAYRFSKEALTVYTVLKAHHLAPLGIRINTESPNATKSGLYAGFVEQMGSAEAAAEVASGLGGRVGNPEEQAYALAFLNSDAASYITGIDLLVDGGGGNAKKYADAAKLPPMAPAPAGRK
ncbi:SDR family oxidoreductase [Streptomyces sp. NPDC051985]|uniref:SDR family oxidoreductase n=1 Tax=Streptomyces sp. NPDC051985 TaxID=3155807 RepID=UPI003437133E